MEDMTWWQQVLVAALSAFGLTALEYLRRGLAKLFDYFAQKSGLAFLARVDDLAMDVVTDLYNSEVEAIKAASADGKLTKEEKERIKQIAVDKLQGLLGVDGLKKLGGLFGPQDIAALGAKIEKAVTHAKHAGKIAKGAALKDPT